jgi:hypothetical protein
LDDEASDRENSVNVWSSDNAALSRHAENAPLISSKFREYNLLKIVQNRFELEHFRQFLSENYASSDLICWLEIEALRRIPVAQVDARNRKASTIRRKFFNINYFFGPNSPASKEEQDKVKCMMTGQ